MTSSPRGAELAHPASPSSNLPSSNLPSSNQSAPTVVAVVSTRPTAEAAERTPCKVLVYSDDVNTRAQVMLAVGRRPAADLPAIEYVETATEPATIARLDVGDIDVAVLDGEAVPAGGMGICRQLKDEIYHCPPVLVLIGRPHDGWLATWSRADAVAAHPLDPIVVAQEFTALLRRRLADAPTR